MHGLRGVAEELLYLLSFESDERVSEPITERRKEHPIINERLTEEMFFLEAFFQSPVARSEAVLEGTLLEFCFLERGLSDIGISDTK